MQSLLISVTIRQTKQYSSGCYLYWKQETALLFIGCSYWREEIVHGFRLDSTGVKQVYLINKEPEWL